MEEQLVEEIKKVKELGEEIGYGNLMSAASALWKADLVEKGIPANGAFVPVCPEEIEETVYDQMIKKHDI